MIDLEKAKKEFIKYTNHFDLENKNIARKVGHSLRVMEISNQLATKLNFSQEEVQIATLIGLLHDIGRFEQRTKYNTFSDINSIDHGKLGVEILEENNYIRKFIEDSKYDEIIKKAIRNHNQYGIEKGLNLKEMQFCKLIKDADKIDILYEGTEIFWSDKQTKEEIEMGEITQKVMEQFQEKVLIQNEVKKTKLDHLIGMLSFVFDLNFKPSIQIVKEKQYINKIINRFNFKDQMVKEKIVIINQEIEKFLEDEIKKE